MIKEKTVSVNVVGRTLNKYKKLGYKCSVGDVIKVKIDDLPSSSHIKITAVCDICGAEKTLSYYAYNKNHKKYNYYSCVKCMQQKIEKTNMKLYGVKRPIQNKDIHKKLEETNIGIYGFSVASKNETIKQKIIDTNIKNYGDISSRTQKIKEKARKTIITKLLKKYKQNNIIKIENSVCYFSCDKGHEFSLSFSNLHNRLKYNVELCSVCNPINSHSSNKETQLLKFIEEIYDGKITTNDRVILNGLELDIYLPELKIAFEFNGLYWHSEIYKDKYYHQKKTFLCQKQNIRLIHIYEDDWFHKQEIIKSMIINNIGLIKEKIFGRKTKIKMINKKNSDDFYNKNHIQGKSSYSINIGLLYGDELVSLMSFKKNKDNYELVRFANKLNCSVIGGASKLLTHFIKNYNPINIISFSNNDYSYGDLYKILNFKIMKILKPDYSYIYDNHRKHKFGFRKNKLQKMGFDINKTEHEICLENNIYRIYDSGKIKWSLNL